MKQRHHAVLMHAYADGHDIQMLCEDDGIEVWVDCAKPEWARETVYRIKPIEYPKSTLQYSDLTRIWNFAGQMEGGEGTATKALRACADEAIECFIQSGEMQKFIDKYGN